MSKLKFLVDNALSPEVAEALRQAGHDAIHVRQYDMGASPDSQVLARAEAEDRILISADTDFGAILALRKATKPSLILFRGESNRRPEIQTRHLLANLPPLAGELERGCIVVFQETKVRVRTLPILSDQPDD